MIQHTHRRTAVTRDGYPIEELSTWVYAPDHPEAVAVDWHGDYLEAIGSASEDGETEGGEVVNGWVVTGVTGSFADPAAVGSFLLRSRQKGIKLVSAEQYDVALAEERERSERLRVAGEAEVTAHLAAEWDARAARWKRVGFTPAEIEAEIGSRPS